MHQHFKDDICKNEEQRKNCSAMGKILLGFEDGLAKTRGCNHNNRITCFEHKFYSEWRCAGCHKVYDEGKTAFCKDCKNIHPEICRVLLFTRNPGYALCEEDKPSNKEDCYAAREGKLLSYFEDNPDPEVIRKRIFIESETK